MRFTFSVIYSLLIIALGVCSVIAWKSRKAIGRSVTQLEGSLIPPVMGNLLIVGSDNRKIALAGSYIYFIGMDLVMYALVYFTARYCKLRGPRHRIPNAVYVILALDVLQLMLNPLFGHAFVLERISVDRFDYYRLIPLAGQVFHRAAVYGVFLAVVLIYIVMVVRTPRIYSERYFIILLSMILFGLWQTFYIFSRTPIDRSMIGFAMFGLLIFYFSLYYRPLRLLDRMLSDIVSDLSEALYLFDPNGKCLWANEKGCELAGVKDENYDTVTAALTELFGEPSENTEVRRLQRIIGTGGDVQYYTLEENRVIDSSGQLSGTYLRIQDVTEAQQKLKRDLYDATHDSLTGLYTREFLYQRITELLRVHPEISYYIVFIDVKNFKVVNDIFGVAFGDHALQCIADWLRDIVTERCCYGRLIGDTFGLCIPESEFDHEKLEELLSVFKIRSERAEYHLLIHMGVYPADLMDADVPVMFDRAHLSLLTIQDEYHVHIAYYNNEIREKLLWNQLISAQLSDAIESCQLCPYLQPIADSSGRIVGAEALARWNHPEHGFLSPGTFIPVFEQNGMVVEVDKHMWRSVCEILARWQRQNRDLFISVNISPKDFYFIDVVSEIGRLVREYGVEPARLRIEITETVMMNDAEKRMEMLKQFRELGFVVEMDDFGSGYSSLNMLKDMPVDVLKIDMKFLGKTGDAEKARTIVKNIITLSKELGITALTEGVETQLQYETLSEMGCKLFQGYYFAKPMPVYEFERFAGITD